MDEMDGVAQPGLRPPQRIWGSPAAALFGGVSCRRWPPLATGKCLYEKHLTLGLGAPAQHLWDTAACYLQRKICRFARLVSAMEDKNDAAS